MQIRQLALPATVLQLKEMALIQRFPSNMGAA